MRSGAERWGATLRYLLPHPQQPNWRLLAQVLMRELGWRPSGGVTRTSSLRMHRSPTREDGSALNLVEIENEAAHTACSGANGQATSASPSVSGAAVKR